MSDSLLGVILLLGAYLLGGVPFGLLIARWVAGIDVRQHGSGNIGATNVYRVVGWRAGVAVWMLDVAKGYVPVLVAQQLNMQAGWQIAAGLAAVVGHSVSPFLRFRGGKGAATSLGVLFGLMWPVAIVAFLIWGTVVVLTGYVSLGTILAAIALTPLTAWLYPGDAARLGFVIAAGLLTIVRHHGNIKRLLRGTENRFPHLTLRRKPRPSHEGQNANGRE